MKANWVKEEVSTMTRGHGFDNKLFFYRKCSAVSANHNFSIVVVFFFLSIIIIFAIQTILL